MRIPRFTEEQYKEINAMRSKLRYYKKQKIELQERLNKMIQQEKQQEQEIQEFEDAHPQLKRTEEDIKNLNKQRVRDIYHQKYPESKYRKEPLEIGDLVEGQPIKYKKRNISDDLKKENENQDE